MAIRALQRIPVAYWPADEARPLIVSLLRYIVRIPATERTSPAAVDALQLADALAATLPLDQAKAVRKELGELGVRVLRVGTVPEQMRYDVDRLVVSRAEVGKSIVMKRWSPRARGRVGHISKPFSNLTIIVREKRETA